MINNSWIDGYKTLLINFITILAAGLVYFFAPATANLLQEFLTRVILPLGIILLGTIFGPWFGFASHAAANLF